MTRYGMVIDLTTCTGCRACVAACALENKTPYWANKYRTHVEDVTRGQYPDVERSFLPHLCMHCDEPACVEACPTGASYVGEGGSVQVDRDKCIDCRYCVAACPYGQRYQYTREDMAHAEAVFGETAGADFMDKCTFCEHRVAQGMKPACVATCLAGARIFGDLDDPTSEVAQIVNSGTAQPIAPEAGTKPKVFYVSDNPEDFKNLPVSVASAGLADFRSVGQNVASWGLGLVAVGALGVFGYARHNAREHLAEVAAKAESATRRNCHPEKGG